jgi:ADP-ribose pyrophosphatase YjhB (NUDIX family)
MARDRNAVLRGIVADFLASRPERLSELGVIDTLWSDDLDMGHRNTYPAHFTASAFVVADTKVLMVKHLVIGKWLVPGGHLETGEPPDAAAVRELLEETGVQGKLLFQDPIDIDCHLIDANPGKSEPEHFHIDICYLMTPRNETLSIDHGEVEGAAWVPWSELTSSRLHRVLEQLRSPPEVHNHNNGL